MSDVFEQLPVVISTASLQQLQQQQQLLLLLELRYALLEHRCGALKFTTAIETAR
jgi:hypothetical protein